VEIGSLFGHDYVARLLRVDVFGPDSEMGLTMATNNPMLNFMMRKP
jgi:hypothetical protein